jgi:hypothetical protein
MNWFKKKSPVLKNKQTAKIEDITYVRNLQEKMASLEVGQCFALATRQGHHIFKLMRIEAYQEKKDG